MAQLPGYLVPGPDISSSIRCPGHGGVNIGLNFFTSFGKGGKPGILYAGFDGSKFILIRYQMRAIDANCSPTLRYWTVLNTPDFTAAQYTGTFCGGSINFTNIHVATYWLEPG